MLNVLCLQSFLFANEYRTAETDSLYNIYTSNAPDSNKAIVLVKLAQILESNSIRESNTITIDDFLQLANNLNNDSLEIDDLAHIIDMEGVKFRNNGDYVSALKFHIWANDVAKRISNKNLHSVILNNIGVVYRRLDDYQTALSYHLDAFKLAEETRNIKSQAIAINSIGNIQLMIGNLDESLENFKQSLILEQKLNNLLGIAINLNNIGNVYMELNDFSKALEYFHLSLDVNTEINSQKGIAICYNDIGGVYEKQGLLNRALQYYQDALDINLELADKYSLAYSFLQVGELYTELEEYYKALGFLNSGLGLSLDIGSKSFIMDSYTALYKINRTKKKYEDAFRFLELSYQYNDSIININVRKDIVRLQIKFESESKESHIALLEQNAEISDLEIKRQKIINLLTLSAFIIALGFVIFLLYYLTNKNKTNKLLLERNRIIEHTKAELDNYSKQLLSAKQEAEKHSKIKSEFLANMSHEIRTPLNSVIGFADLLTKSVTDPKQINYLRVIKTSGNTLLTLINDILDLSKIEAGKLSIDYEPINPELIFDDISQMFSQLSQEKNLELRTSISSNLPKLILFSELRLRQIMFNLVGNAIKFTEKGSVTIVANAEEASKEGEINLRITIKDTGVGIDKDEIDDIFDPFNQAKSNTSEQGTGLGLAITKRLTEMMQGTIALNSTKGEGSQFTICFSNLKVIDSANENNTIKLPLINEQKVVKLLVLTNDLHSCKILKLEGVEKFNLDIVTNLDDARAKVIQNNVIILCGYEISKARNAINVLQKVDVSQSLSYILFVNEKDSLPDYDDNIYLIKDSNSGNEITRALNRVFSKIARNEVTNIFFSGFDKYESDSEFINDLTYIYNSSFRNAIDTKMTSSIENFIDLLYNFAQEYDCKGLIEYCNDLSLKVTNFEIDDINNLLAIFETNYKKSIV